MFFQVKRVEDVILDCGLDIVINHDGDVDDEGGRHKVNGCHVVNGVGVGGVRGDSMKNRIFRCRRRRTRF